MNQWYVEIRRPLFFGFMGFWHKARGSSGQVIYFNSAIWAANIAEFTMNKPAYAGWECRIVSLDGLEYK